MDIGELTQPQYEQLKQTIVKYQATFSKDDDDIGLCKLVEHKIDLIDERPIKIPHRRVPPHQWDEVPDYIQKSFDRGIIRESSSPYASPIVLVRKKNGKLRLCVDYRCLNSKTHKDAYPLPRIEDALDVLKGAQYLCRLDLAHGFNQVPVKEADIEKTAFRTGTGGLYEYVRMPFGQPFRTKVNYLGHVISNRGTSPNPEKVRAVCEWSRPETPRVLRGFLGLAGYYRRFIKGMPRLQVPYKLF